MPARQSPPSTRTTACGRESPDAAGNTARATPAAFAVGSAPSTRVVFFVASKGKPRLPAASWPLPLAPTAAAFVPEPRPPPLRRPHAVRAPRTATSIAAAATGRESRTMGGEP